MASSTARRVSLYRAGLRAAGLRPLQIWVPDTRRAGFAEECRRQAELAAQADDAEILNFLDEAVADLDGWTE